MDPNFITIWYHSCKHGHVKDQTSASDTQSKEIQCTFPSSLTLQKSSCRVLEHLWQGAAWVPLQKWCFYTGRVCGCVLPSLHCASAQPQVEAVCWRAGQTDEVSHDEVSHLPVCAVFIREHSFNSLPLLCRDANKEWPSASPTKAAGGQAAHGAAFFHCLCTFSPKKHQELHNTVQIKLQIYTNFLSIVKEKMSAHSLNVSKCKYQCSKSIFAVKCTLTLIYSRE